MGLSAIYWLPFIIETPLVKQGNGISIATETFLMEFLPLTKIVQSSFFYEFVGKVQLGSVTIAIGILAFLANWVGEQSARRSAVFYFGGVVALCLFLMIEPARGIWQLIPSTAMVGFPWRLMSLINLGLAILIGSLPAALLEMRPIAKLDLKLGAGIIPAIIAVAVSILVITTTMGKLTPSRMEYPTGELTLAELARFEGYSGFVGLTYWDEYFPMTMQVPPQFNAPVISNQAQNLSTPQIDLVRYHPTFRELVITASTPISLSMRTSYFPDWQATIDGITVKPFPTTPLGLLTVAVPEGVHRVTVFLGDLPARQIGTWLSVVSAIALVVAVWFGRKHVEYPFLLSVAIGLVTVVFALPSALAVTTQVQPMQSLRVPVSQQLTLIGLQVEQARLDSDVWVFSGTPTHLHLRVYWHVKQLLGRDAFRWRLIDAANNVWIDAEQPARYGTGFPAAWVPNQIIEDHYDIFFDQTTLPGQYTLQVGTMKTMSRLEKSSCSRAVSWFDPSPI